MAAGLLRRRVLPAERLRAGRALDDQADAQAEYDARRAFLRAGRRVVRRADLAFRLRLDAGRLDLDQLDALRALLVLRAGRRVLDLRADRLRDVERVDLRAALRPLALRAAERRRVAPDLLLVDRLRFVITTPPVWVG